MRIVVSSFVFCLSILFCVQLHTQINRDELRKSEMREAVSRATMQSLEDVIRMREKGSVSRNEVVALLLEHLVISLPSDLEITVRLISMDLVKGLIDVEVTGKYNEANGKTKEIVIRRTVIEEK